MEWYEILISVLTGLTTAIPLVIKLVEYVKKSSKGKNWDKLLTLVTNLMKEAESKFDNGIERKEWVLMMVRATSSSINYDIDINAVSELVDSLCAMTKIVNAPSVQEVV